MATYSADGLQHIRNSASRVARITSRSSSLPLKYSNKCGLTIIRVEGRRYRRSQPVV